MEFADVEGLQVVSTPTPCGTSPCDDPHKGDAWTTTATLSRPTQEVRPANEQVDARSQRLLGGDLPWVETTTKEGTISRVVL